MPTLDPIALCEENAALRRRVALLETGSDNLMLDLGAARAELLSAQKDVERVRYEWDVSARLCERLRRRLREQADLLVVKTERIVELEHELAELKAPFESVLAFDGFHGGEAGSA